MFKRADDELRRRIRLQRVLQPRSHSSSGPLMQAVKADHVPEWRRSRLSVVVNFGPGELQRVQWQSFPHLPGLSESPGLQNLHLTCMIGRGPTSPRPKAPHTSNRITVAAEPADWHTKR